MTIPDVFFTYLLAAFQKIDEVVGQDIEGILGVNNRTKAIAQARRQGLI